VYPTRFAVVAYPNPSQPGASGRFHTPPTGNSHDAALGWPAMSFLAAPPAAPPTGAPRMLRAAGPLRPPSPCQGLHYYAARGTTTGGGEAGCGRRPQLVLRRCSPAGESMAASGDGGLSRLLYLNSLLKFPLFSYEMVRGTGLLLS